MSHKTITEQEKMPRNRVDKQLSRTDFLIIGGELFTPQILRPYKTKLHNENHAVNFKVCTLNLNQYLCEFRVCVILNIQRKFTESQTLTDST